MKKHTLLPVFVFILFSASILSSCTKKPADCTVNETTQLGGYKGGHSILGGAYTFDDSLTITNPVAGDSKITIESEVLGTSLTGTFDANNCGRVILDSVFIPSQTIQTVTLTNIRAGGYGVFNGTTLNTVINIKSGNAIAGSVNIPIAGQSLTGTFTK